MNPTPQQQRCTWCGYVYDAAAGDPARGVAAGTPFDALPEAWCCPDCRAPQADFVLAEGLAFPQRRKSA